MKKAILGVILFVLIATAYLVWTDFGLIKKLVGYNVPALNEPKVVIPREDQELSFLNIPEGFEISVVAKDLDNPRVILFDPKGRMLVSETKAGRVSILEDKDKNGDFENKRVLIEGLRLPHGLDFYEDVKSGTTYLYIAETNRVSRYSYDINSGKLVSNNGENIAAFPADGRHFTRTIAFGANFRQKPILGVATINPIKLYMSVGSSCDVCEEDSWKRAAILESDAKGSYTAEFAGGLRNSVFFTFHPITGEIWATDMGRDNLGDDLPPDEVNIVKVAGAEHKFGARRYGWPFCYGDKIKDRTFKPEKWERIDITDDCGSTEPPVIEIQAHSAPLGLTFVPSRLTTSDVHEASDVKWPKEWGGDLLVAYHGSWNRSVPTGYKIVRYDLDKNGEVLSQKSVDFISGWLSSDKKSIYGRPVDLKFDPKGDLYISDDANGIIYKVNPI